MKLSVFALVLTLLAVGAFSQIPSPPSYIHNPVTVNEDGYWGVWSDVFSSKNGYLICGAEMRFQDNQKSGDDTAANGLRVVFCKPREWNIQVQKQYFGLWGTWKGMVMCPEKYYVDAFQARIQEQQGKEDDTALNGLRFRCNSQQKNLSTIITIYEGLWGTWRNWHYAGEEKIAFFDGFYFLDSFQVRFEPPQGRGDETGMNGLKFTSMNYITAVAKNLKLSPEQQAILDEKLKLPFPQFWTESATAMTENTNAFRLRRKQYQFNLIQKWGFQGYWWGYTMYMVPECFGDVVKSSRIGCSMAFLKVPEVWRDDLLISMKKIYKIISDAKMAYFGIFLTKLAYVGPIWPQFA